MEDKGIVFDIQHYSIHDGPGIRTNIFLKGCPLRCLWCQNPESQSLSPQVMYQISKCVQCEACISACPNGAVKRGYNCVVTDRSRCMGCMNCVEVCKPKARTAAGKTMTVEEVIGETAQDKLFYDTSGGGITLTGGEVLAQPQFAKAILKRAKELGIHTVVETCGYAKWEILREILEYTDLVLYDVKHMDTRLHKKYTGVSNERILENLSRLSQELGKPVVSRTPVIPGYNDDESNIRRMGVFLSQQVPTLTEVNLLPYHSMGEGKREQLEDKTFGSFSAEPPYERKMEELKEILSQFGLMVK